MVQKLSNRKKLFFVALIFLSIRLINAQQYPGTNIRGQVKAYNAYYNNYFALSNTVVDLYYSPGPNQFVFVSQTITNTFGLYFFYAIIPGNYFIQVNKSKNYQIFVTQISYYNYQYNYNQFQDLPVLYY